MRKEHGKGCIKLGPKLSSQPPLLLLRYQHYSFHSYWFLFSSLTTEWWISSAHLLSPAPHQLFLSLTPFSFSIILSPVSLRIWWSFTVPMRLLICNRSWEPLVCLVSVPTQKAEGWKDLRCPQPWLRAICNCYQVTRITAHFLLSVGHARCPPTLKSCVPSISPHFTWHLLYFTWFLKLLFLGQLFCLLIQIPREEGICNLQKCKAELFGVYSPWWAPGLLIVDG